MQSAIGLFTPPGIRVSVSEYVLEPVFGYRHGFGYPILLATSFLVLKDLLEEIEE